MKRIIGHSEDDETFPTYVISSPGSDGVKKCAVKEKRKIHPWRMMLLKKTRPD